MKDSIYLDNAATTSLSPEVYREMAACMETCYGNPSSIHGTGREAYRLLDRARKQVAAALNAQPQEIYFTSGGSESDNWGQGGGLCPAEAGKASDHQRRGASRGAEHLPLAGKAGL